MQFSTYSSPVHDVPITSFFRDTFYTENLTGSRDRGRQTRERWALWVGK